MDYINLIKQIRETPEYSAATGEQRQIFDGFIAEAEAAILKIPKEWDESAQAIAAATGIVCAITDACAKEKRLGQLNSDIDQPFDCPNERRTNAHCDNYDEVTTPRLDPISGRRAIIRSGHREIYARVSLSDYAKLYNKDKSDAELNVWLDAITPAGWSLRAVLIERERNSTAVPDDKNLLVRLIFE